MLSNAFSLAATILDSPQVRKQHSGHGVVEKRLDQGAYVIRTETGRITVKLQRGSLALNTPVVITARGGEMHIRVIPQPQGFADGVAISGRIPQIGADPRILQFLPNDNPGVSSSHAPQNSLINTEQLRQFISALRDYLPAFDASMGKQVREIIAETEPYLKQQGPAEPVPARIINVLHSLSRDLVVPQARESAAIELRNDLRQGFFLFETGREAATWLKDNAVTPGTVQGLNIDPAASAVVRVLPPADNGANHALVMSGERSHEEIRQFVLSELRSPIWRMAPADQFSRILYLHGQIDTARLSEIDRLICADTALSSRIERLDSGTFAPKAAMWLAVVADTSAKAAHFAQRVPVFAPQEVVETYERLASLVRESERLADAGGAQKHGGADGVIEQPASLSAQNQKEAKSQAEPITLESMSPRAYGAKDLIAALISKLGLDTESKLAGVSTGAPDNLKIQLLELLQLIEQRAGADNTAERIHDRAAQAAEIIHRTLAALQGHLENRGQVDEAVASDDSVESRSGTDAPSATAQSFAPSESADPSLDQLLRNLVGIASEYDIRSATSASSQGAPQAVDLAQAVTASLDAIGQNILEVIRELDLAIERMANSGRISLSDATRAREFLAQLLRYFSDGVKGFSVSFPPQGAHASSIQQLAETIRATALNQLFPIQQAAAPGQTGEGGPGSSTAFLSQSSVSLEEAVRRLPATVHSLLDILRVSSLPSPLSASDAFFREQAAQNVRIVTEHIERFMSPLTSSMTQSATDAEAQSSELTGQFSGRLNSLCADLLQLVRSAPHEVVRSLEALHSQFSSPTAPGFSPQAVDSVFAQLQQAFDTSFERAGCILQQARESILSLMQQHMDALSRHLDSLATLGSRTSQELLAQAPALAQQLREQLAHGPVHGAPNDTLQSDIVPRGQLESTLQQSLAETTSRIERILAHPSSTFGALSHEMTEQLSRGWRDMAAMVENGFRSHAAVIQSLLNQAGGELRDIAAQLAQAPHEQRGDLVRQAQDTVRRLSADIQRVLEQADRHLQRLLGESGDARPGRTGQMEQTVERLLNSVTRELESMMRMVFSEVEHLGARSALSADSSQAQSLTQQVENALTRLESLQLLARPTPTAEGQQQILSLPVNIGGEWTEMSVRILRRKAARGKNDKGNFSVSMAIAPTYLGSIDVQMQYSRRRDLAVSLEFERDASRVWFEQNRDAIHKALSSLGFPSVRLSVRAARPSNSDSVSSGITPPTRSDSSLDLFG